MSTPGLTSALAVNASDGPALMEAGGVECYHIVRDATLAVLGDTGGEYLPLAVHRR